MSAQFVFDYHDPDLCSVVGELQRRAVLAIPNEICGFVMSNYEIVEINNVAPDPTYAFVMDEKQLKGLEPRYGEIEAIWHSHPKGSTWPSPGDMRAINTPGCIDPNWQYWIVTATGVWLCPLH